MQVVYEHLHRYALAAGIARDRAVIDLGSGEGYGSALLAEHAQRVLGVELDPDAVEHAKATYRRANLEFEAGSVLELDRRPAGEFDLAVCFEVVEHVDRQQELLAGARHVLNDNGVLVISTPDREAYSYATGEANPYHVRELDRAEFVELVRAHFVNAAFFGQGVAFAGSWMDALGGGPGTADNVQVELADTGWRLVPPAPPTYLLAVASNGPLPDLPATSRLVDPSLQVLRRREAELSALVAERDREIAEIRATRGWRLLEALRGGRGR